MNKKILCLVIISLFCSHSLANQSVSTEKLMLSLPVLLTIWGTVKNTGLNNVDFRWESIKPLQAVNGQDSHVCKLSQKDAATSSATSSQSEAGSKKQYKKTRV